MAELSQADLDALFGDLTTPTETKPESSGIDNLLKDLEALTNNAETKAEEPGKEVPDSSSENLSQDEIDQLIKQFLG